MLWRILIAIVAVVLANLLVQPVAHLLGFPLSSDLLLVFHIVVAGLAVFYVIKGPHTW